MPYPTRIVANAVLSAAWVNKIPVNHLKLQKLAFILNGWSLANGVKLLHEPPQAWEFGPTYESIYFACAHYGSKDITEHIKSMDCYTGKMANLVPVRTDNQFWSLLGKVIENYAQRDALELSAMCHAQDTPWHRARIEKLSEIPEQYIYEHYHSRLQTNQLMRRLKSPTP